MLADRCDESIKPSAKCKHPDRCFWFHPLQLIAARMYYLLGASIRALSQTITRSGHCCVGADLFADWDTSNYCDVKKIDRFESAAELIKQSPVEGCVVAGGIENKPALLAQIADSTNMTGSSVSAIANVRNPFVLEKSLRASGLETLKLRRTIPSRDVGWVIKPFCSVGGNQVRLLNGRNGEWINTHQQYLQQYIAGTPMSAVYVSSPRQCLLIGVSFQIVKKTRYSDFAYVGSIGPIKLNATHTNAIHRYGQVIAKEFGLLGWFGVDFVKSDDEIRLLEVNPRYTASMELFELASADLRLFDLHLAGCGKGCLAVPKLEYSDLMIGKRYVFNSSMVATQVTSRMFDRLANGAGQAWRSRSDIPWANDWIQPGHPVCTVWAYGDNIAEVETQLDDGVEQVHDLLRGAREEHQARQNQPGTAARGHNQHE